MWAELISKYILQCDVHRSTHTNTQIAISHAVSPAHVATICLLRQNNCVRLNAHEGRTRPRNNIPPDRINSADENRKMSTWALWFCVGTLCSVANGGTFPPANENTYCIFTSWDLTSAGADCINTQSGERYFCCAFLRMSLHQSHVTIIIIIMHMHREIYIIVLSCRRLRIPKITTSNFCIIHRGVRRCAPAPQHYAKCHLMFVTRHFRRLLQFSFFVELERKTHRNASRSERQHNLVLSGMRKIVSLSLIWFVALSLPIHIHAIVIYGLQNPRRNEFNFDTIYFFHRCRCNNT